MHLAWCFTLCMPYCIAASHKSLTVGKRDGSKHQPRHTECGNYIPLFASKNIHVCIRVKKFSHFGVKKNVY